MNHTEKAAALRADTTVHYNCGQSVLMAFADEMGMTEEAAKNLGAHMGSGMRHGTVCGALSSALMVLGAAGYDDKTALELLRNFKQAHGSTQCAELLKSSRERGVEKKTHCDGLVMEMAQAVSDIIAQGK